MEGMKYCLITKSRSGEQHGVVLILMLCYMLKHIREEVIKLNEQFSHLKSLWGWRCRTKLAVRGSPENPLIGLYQEGTHNVVDIPQCKGSSSKYKCCCGAA